MTRSSLVTTLALVVALAGCGGSKQSGTDLVWCVAPGEVVDAKFKREYPELHIPRAACDAIDEGQR